MKNLFLCIAFVMACASCQSNDEPHSPLTEIIVKVVESHSNGTDGDSYIIYDASTGEYTAMSEDEYALVNAFANVIVHEDNTASRAPQGDGWVVGGRGKGRAGAMKLAMKLANNLEQQRDFEIHVEYADDGSFTVWYRYV